MRARNGAILPRGGPRRFAAPGAVKTESAPPRGTAGPSPVPVCVRPYEPGDENALTARGLRPCDEREAWKVLAMPAGRALHLTLAASRMAASILIEGRIAAMLGVASSHLGETGAPWLLAHKDFERPETAVCMGRVCFRFVRHWLTVYKRLENYADPEHAEGLALLRRLGFSLRIAPARGPIGHNLILFRRDAPCVSV